MSKSGLHEYLFQSAARWPDKIAVEDPGADRKVSFGELADLARGANERLRHMGVERGDRVGIYLTKSIDAIASMHGIMAAGAAYVPVDPDAPAVRNAFIHYDGSVSAVIIERKFVVNYEQAFSSLGELPPLIVIDNSDSRVPLSRALEIAQEQDPAEPREVCKADSNDLAYVLYTSGSTGKPKGVMLTHENAVSFVTWCAETFAPSRDDRCSSHAPFHFDLSILDIYMSMMHGCTLVLIGSTIGKEPQLLAPLIAKEQISIWYSAPSILSLLAQFGDLGQYDYSDLRIVLFAGEVFPVKHLRLLKSFWDKPYYFNLYGPTETNVCTYLEIPREISDERNKPFPIGRTCSHLDAMVIDEAGNKLRAGEEGELVVFGPAVTQGYWNLAERNAVAFHIDGDGTQWYRTGDLVVDDGDGVYDFLGRRDRMIKKRGYRIELGEIESGLYQHPDIKEVAVVAVTDSEDNIGVHAFYCSNDGGKLSIIKLKSFCAKLLPLYMVPDFFHACEALPRTSTGKTDYQKLSESV